MKSTYGKILLTACILLSVSRLDVSAERWGHGELKPQHQTFCDTYLGPVLKQRATVGNAATLEAIERVYQRAERDFNSSYFFLSALWYEGQIRSGEDEAWCEQVYQYLWDRRMKDPQYQLRVGEGSLGVYESILGNKAEQGKAAEVRKGCLFMEDLLEKEKGLNTINTSIYEDLGPVFEFTPLARVRNGPVFEHQLPIQLRTPVWREERDFIDFRNMYAIGFLADGAFQTGDWIRAAELSTWTIRYADEYVKDENLLIQQTAGICGLGAYKRLAAIAIQHGYPEEAARFLEKNVLKAEGPYNMGEIDVLHGKLKHAIITIDTGNLSENAVGIADKTLEHYIYGRGTYYMAILGIKLDKARILHALGQTDEAWAMVDELFAETAEAKNRHRITLVVNTAIDLAMADGGTRPELEAWFQRALEHERRQGNKYAELPLYEKYARYLMIHGRFEEAARIQTEAVRLSKAMSLPKRLKDNQDALALMNQTREKQNKAAATDDPLPTATTSPAEPTDGEASTAIIVTTAPGVDIQPRESLTTSLAGHAAHGRFYLHNPSGRVRRGELVLSGPLEQLKWQTETWLTALSSPALPNDALTKELVLQPSESRIIDITGMPADDGQGAAITCAWTPADEGQPSVAGTWTYERSTTEKRAAVVDAHVMQGNPFYLIPVHHMIQRTGAENEETINFAVEASAPTRVESYDAATGELLAIDANGDGDFEDPGDFIAIDANRDNWPDVHFASGQAITSLVLYVRPHGTAATDQELTVKLQVNGEWRTDAIDVIRQMDL